MHESYHVTLRKEQLVFSAAHFITFGENICERLHGHNYGLEIHVQGLLNEHGYVVDFIALRDAAYAIVQELDHHVLLPTRHPTIRVEPDAREVVVRFQDRRWVFPRGDCRLLPIGNTTAELLAAWIAEELWQRLPKAERETLTHLRVSVDENHGQWGSFERHIAENGPRG